MAKLLFHNNINEREELLYLLMAHDRFIIPVQHYFFLVSLYLEYLFKHNIACVIYTVSL